MPLTRTQIDAAAPREKPLKLFDGRGLYLEISPTGSRWWRFKYRFANKENRISLGTYPDVGRRTQGSARRGRTQAGGRWDRSGSAA
jgi:hypothetical protein